ncbi:MAG: hypothetical protein KGH61_02295 [Candidatus Micrarchaeota archaeon]|nr:hypothetical protein [Candidatus Micrarchaeota archaeon]MDE1847758.1 hypothetical protein [Candidatus Micrarchaeota archaeon]MDE1863901.1 hypothetical protein [Candidatus Micrarchaeota archaeon]
MARIVFRTDGWFDAGKDSSGKPEYESYKQRQELKSKLEVLNHKNLDQISLIEQAQKIRVKQLFKGALRIDGSKIWANTLERKEPVFVGLALRN